MGVFGLPLKTPIEILGNNYYVVIILRGNS